MRKRWLQKILTAGAVAGAIWVPPSAGSTYVAMRDEDLARRAPVIVFAEAIGQWSELGEFESASLPFTTTQFRPLEVLKGEIGNDSFSLRLPGGSIGEVDWNVPGVPRFEVGQKAVLFLATQPAEPRYALTELALSSFGVYRDSSGGSYAIRPAFRFGGERLISPGGATAERDAIRPLPQFLAALREAGAGRPMSAVPAAAPAGALRLDLDAVMVSQWVNIGGREPGRDCVSETCLLRWFWDTGDSPAASVVLSGTQSSLDDGSDGRAHLLDALESWKSISETKLEIEAAPAGPVIVQLDADSTPFGGWSGPLGCGQGGLLGLTMPLPQGTAKPFGTDAYVPIVGARVYLRRVSCPGQYPAAWFRSLAVHELGHVLGLGHSTGEPQSGHSASGSAELESAVMTQFLRLPDPPAAPQADDQAGLRHLYPGPAPAVQPPAEPPTCGPGTERICPPDQAPKYVAPRG